MRWVGEGWGDGSVHANRIKITDLDILSHSSDDKALAYTHTHTQNNKTNKNFSGSNTDGSFTSAVSNLLLSPLETLHS